MRRLTTGDRVIAQGLRAVADGTPGTIVGDDHTTLPYAVRFEGRRGLLWVGESQAMADPAEKSPSKPTRELKVGDKVRIKPREWYEANKDSYGNVHVPHTFSSSMAPLCGKTFEIGGILHHSNFYKLKGLDWNFSKEMFDLDEPTSESAFTAVCKVAKSLFTGSSEPIIQGKLPLIKTNKLLTNIKLD